jgi:hypothetical protein
MDSSKLSRSPPTHDNNVVSFQNNSHNLFINPMMIDSKKYELLEQRMSKTQQNPVQNLTSRDSASQKESNGDHNDAELDELQFKSSYYDGSDEPKDVRKILHWTFITNLLLSGRK